MKILDQKQIDQKIRRLAIEILEQNFKEKTIILAGMNKNGYGFAKLLKRAIQKRAEVEILLSKIELDPSNPIESSVSIDIEEKVLKNKVIIIVDDVANTGRTLFYAFKPFMRILVKKIEVAVLVDRKHKSFPVKVDYVGLSLSTTFQEHIEVNLKTAKERAVFLS